MANTVFENGFDALITPTPVTSHVPADFDFTEDSFTLEGQKMVGFYIGALTVPWNLLNWCPVVSAPAGFASYCMPVGMQIVGKPYACLKVFQIAHACEAAAPRLFAGKLMPDFRG